MPLQEIIRAGTPNFGLLGDKSISERVIKVLLLNLLDFFGAEWNETQLNDCAEIIVTDYYWLSMAEFKTMTIRAKKGAFGKDYNKLSPHRLLQWMEEFANECLMTRGDMHSELDKKPAPIEAPGTIDVFEKMKKAMLALGAKWDKNFTDNAERVSFKNREERSQEIQKFRERVRANHEAWKTCDICGWIFDQRLDESCPECTGKALKEAKEEKENL